MKWHAMGWTEKIAELLIYSTALIICNISVILWYPLSNLMQQRLYGISQFIIDLINYSILFILLAFIIAITLSIIKKIR